MAQIHRDLVKHFGNQTKTAQALGVKQASVSNWCTDRNKMEFEYALKAEQLGIDVTKFEYIYLDSYNREQTGYRLDKTLSLTLVSGYNAKLRYKIIVRWQELENNQPHQMSEIELLHAMTGRMVENERLQKQLASKVQGIESELHEVKAIQSAIYQNNNHFAVMGFARLHNIKLPNEVAASLSRKAKQLSNEKGVLIGQTSDTRYGTVKTYHEDILKQVFVSEGFIH